MRRTQVQLDEATYVALRRRAYQAGRSMSSVVRETLAAAMGTQAPAQPPRLEDFRFVGIGRSARPPRRPVSEHHDEALAEALAPRRRR